MNKIWNNTKPKKKIKNHQKFRRVSESPGRVRRIKYLQQAGEDDDTNRFLKP